VVLVPSPDGATIPTDSMLEAIDEETQLVCVSHVLFRSSYVQDLRSIAEKAHAVGALVVADLYQSAGSLPMDVVELGLDFATGGSVKWLCGGPGAGYLYVRPDLAPRLRPRITGWMAHKTPFAFLDGPIDYSDSMFRFLHGTPAIPALYAAQSGFEIIGEIGVARIREKSLRQTARLIELAGEHGLRVCSPRLAAERGGVVVLDVDRGQEITRELLSRGTLVDFRPGAGIRVAPHFYNKDEEIDELIRQVTALSR
jgi:kynureninase